MAGTFHWLGRLGVFGLALGYAAASHAGTLNIVITKSDGSPLGNAVVSISAAGQQTVRAKTGTKAVMIQQNKQFAPFVLPVQDRRISEQRPVPPPGVFLLTGQKF